MLSPLLASLVLLSSIGYGSVLAWVDSSPPPLVEPTTVDWASIRTDEAAWQDSCGHSKRVGSVCLDATNGDPKLFSVSKSAVQNTALSGGGHYLVAYCPNLDKKEKPYTIVYGFQEAAVTYQILGRNANERCCHTRHVDKNNDPAPIACIEPAAIAADVFPTKADLTSP